MHFWPPSLEKIKKQICDSLGPCWPQLRPAARRLLGAAPLRPGPRHLRPAPGPAPPASLRTRRSAASALSPPPDPARRAPSGRQLLTSRAAGTRKPEPRPQRGRPGAGRGGRRRTMEAGRTAAARPGSAGPCAGTPRPGAGEREAAGEGGKFGRLWSRPSRSAGGSAGPGGPRVPGAPHPAPLPSGGDPARSGRAAELRAEGGGPGPERRADGGPRRANLLEARRPLCRSAALGASPPSAPRAGGRA